MWMDAYNFSLKNDYNIRFTYTTVVIVLEFRIVLKN